MLLAPVASRAATSVPVVPLPTDLAWPEALPKYTQLRGRDRWMDWALASVKQPNGFDRRTGEPLTRTTDVIAAPYPEFRAVAKLPASTSFRDVISAARALALDGDRDSNYGNAQAVLQSESGSWYITMAGVRETEDHIEPMPITWSRDAVVAPRQRDVVAIVDNTDWANFSDHEL